MSQAHDLHRALLRPAIIHTLRAAGFHSTKPSVLDTLLNLSERYLLLLATTTAKYATSSHNDLIPTVTDVRLALTDCGVLQPARGSGAEEAWLEIMRSPIDELSAAVAAEAGPLAGSRRATAEKRKREDEDVSEIRSFARWVDGPQHHEIKRIAGMMQDAATATVGGAGPAAGTAIAAAMPLVGVGGEVVHAEDFLTTLKKKYHAGKAGVVDENSKFAGTVLGPPAEDRQLLVEGGPVQRIADWRPKAGYGRTGADAAMQDLEPSSPMNDSDSELSELGDTSTFEVSA